MASSSSASGTPGSGTPTSLPPRSISTATSTPPPLIPKDVYPPLTKAYKALLKRLDASLGEAILQAPEKCTTLVTDAEPYMHDIFSLMAASNIALRLALEHLLAAQPPEIAPYMPKFTPYGQVVIINMACILQNHVHAKGVELATATRRKEVKRSIIFMTQRVAMAIDEMVLRILGEKEAQREERIQEMMRRMDEAAARAKKEVGIGTEEEPKVDPWVTIRELWDRDVDLESDRDPDVDVDADVDMDADIDGTAVDMDMDG
ncbi:hypothetical protein EDC01DRAFT_781432 [Geopyxis carbonaria]|nr:hypothetical protein EDC01DRAFT_781432 [Geopyxis carbonaria]